MNCACILNAALALAITPALATLGSLENTPTTSNPTHTTPGVPHTPLSAGPTDSLCPGDTDGDRSVGIDDLLTVLTNFGQFTDGGFGAGDVLPPGNPDGVINLQDLLLVLARFGQDCN